MDKFLDELPAPAKPPTTGELSQRAMAMARQLGHAAPEEAVEPPAKGKDVEPFSLEMYFDAFVRKMNRSAAFVKNEPRAHGSRKALVEISLNPDGSLKNYRVLRSADQNAEIAYIKSVIDRASPFSAFPPDIRNGTDSLSILMCIMPSQSGEGGGFSRSFGGQDCRD
jgi:outer membrane biosynthesis protein TonB